MADLKAVKKEVSGLKAAGVGSGQHQFSNPYDEDQVKDVEDYRVKDWKNYDKKKAGVMTHEEAREFHKLKKSSGYESHLNPSNTFKWDPQGFSVEEKHKLRDARIIKEKEAAEKEAKKPEKKEKIVIKEL